MSPSIAWGDTYPLMYLSGGTTNIHSTFSGLGGESNTPDLSRWQDFEGVSGVTLCDRRVREGGEGVGATDRQHAPAGVLQEAYLQSICIAYLLVDAEKKKRGKQKLLKGGLRVISHVTACTLRRELP